MERILITGASGFIGRHLLTALLAGDTEIHLLTRHPEQAFPADTQVHRADTATPDGIFRAVQASRPTTVFHLASHNVSVNNAEQVPSLINANVLYSALLAEALSEYSPAGRLIALGSAWQHRDGLPYSPINLYAASKQAMADIFHYYSAQRGLRIAVLKLFHVWGPDDPRQRLVTTLCRAALNGQKVAMSGGEQVINLVHVADVVRGLLHIAERMAALQPGSQEEWSLDGDDNPSVRQLAALIAAIGGRPIQAEWGALPYKDGEFFDTVRLPQRLPGWQPQIRLRTGLPALLQAEAQALAGKNAAPPSDSSFQPSTELKSS